MTCLLWSVVLVYWPMMLRHVKVYSQNQFSVCILSFVLLQIQGQCIIDIESLHIKSELKLKQYFKTETLKSKNQTKIKLKQNKNIILV